MSLSKSTVHVWTASLDLPDARRRELSTYLSPDEEQRAARLRRPQDCHRFVVARGLLRELLAGYLGSEAQAIRFEYSPHGKPVLAGIQADSPLQFNVSHSGGRALFAFTLKNRIGVDIEAIRTGFATEAVARRFFSPGEVDRLLALPEPVRARAFFDCWARKEAYIKGHGMGFSIPLSSFEVAFEPGKDAALLRSEIDSVDAARWSLVGLDAGPEFAAAVAVERKRFELSQRSLPS